MKKHIYIRFLGHLRKSLQALNPIETHILLLGSSYLSSNSKSLFSQYVGNIEKSQEMPEKFSKQN